MDVSRDSVDAIWPLVIGTAATLVTIFIQAFALRSILYLVHREHLRGHVGVSFWLDLFIVAGSVLVAFAAHLVEIAAWGAVFYRYGKFSDFAAAFYHSALNYTTLGDEGMMLSSSWRLLGPLEAADGMLMFGVTTAVIFAVIQRLAVMRMHADI